jgi:hypothetical protein
MGCDGKGTETGVRSQETGDRRQQTVSLRALWLRETIDAPVATASDKSSSYHEMVQLIETCVY